MTKTKEKARKKGLVTINSFSDETGLDRRTIGKYVGESGLQPVERHRGAAFYDKGELINALSAVMEKKRMESGGAPKRAIELPNFLRIISEETIGTLAWDCAGRIACAARGLLHDKGIPKKELDGFTVMMWLWTCDTLWEFLKQDRVDENLKNQMEGQGLDELWASQFGYKDKSKPRDTFNIPVPPKIQKYAQACGFELKDPFPIHNGWEHAADDAPDIDSQTEDSPEDDANP